MGRLTQEDRAFRLETTLGRDVLVLQSFNGEEGVSMPFHYTLDLLSEDDAIDPASVLREPFTITLSLDDGERHIHGLVRRFVQLGQKDDLTQYRAEIVPWFWFLGLSQDCRIFQDKSVIEIITEVFDGLGYTDFDDRCTSSYPPREYCVQYRESNLAFVSRLLEEEGIFYFFEHGPDGHNLILADSSNGVAACPGQAIVPMAPQDGRGRDEDGIKELRVESQVHIGTVTLRDYDFTRPGMSLQATRSEPPFEEVYDYPGGYSELSDGERYAKLRLEGGGHRGSGVTGGGNCRAFRSGFSFALTDHYRPDANQEYLLLHVRHHAEAGDFQSWNSAPLDYSNDFTAIPLQTKFRPARDTPKPRISGTQTAVVVGPSGEEIFTDEYGRVRVHFHWDRQEPGQNSSCWVRVSHPWAGKGWGGIHLPRIGQEVIVEFLEGDPDRPIITGRVYNAAHPVPYELPANQTQSGVKSHSSKGGGTDNYNEIRLEDLKGEEHFYVQAEKDKEELVKNDRVETVGHDETIDIGNNATVSIGNDQSITIGASRTESVGANESITIGGDRTESVDGQESIQISGKRSKSVGDDDITTIGGNLKVDVGKNATENVGGGRKVSIGKDLDVTVGGSHKESVGKDLVLNAKKIQLLAKDEITLKAGKAKIILKKNGDVTISGKKITVKGSGDVVLKGKKIAQN